jgi:hypothetical protein
MWKQALKSDAAFHTKSHPNEFECKTPKGIFNQEGSMGLQAMRLAVGRNRAVPA